MKCIHNVINVTQYECTTLYTSKRKIFLKALKKRAANWRQNILREWQISEDPQSCPLHGDKSKWFISFSSTLAKHNSNFVLAVWIYVAWGHLRIKATCSITLWSLNINLLEFPPQASFVHFWWICDFRNKECQKRILSVIQRFSLEQPIR